MDRTIHIFGASGSGTTTLGEALSKRVDIPHFDTDEFYWVKTPVPFTQPRAVEERVEMLKAAFFSKHEWVSSGSFVDWGDFAIPLFTLAVFVWIPHDLRMERLKAREIKRYGLEAISPGGVRYENYLAFMEYAGAYDSAGLDVDIRSMKLHEKWMKKLPCNILKLETPMPVEALADRVEGVLASLETNPREPGV